MLYLEVLLNSVSTAKYGFLDSSRFKWAKSSIESIKMNKLLTYLVLLIDTKSTIFSSGVNPETTFFNISLKL